MKKFNFTIHKKLDGTLARTGELVTPHGTIQTPAFMVVGTKASVKALTPDMVRDIGAQAVLGNTYHLYLQPGDSIVRDGGGLAQFMNWAGPTMTDSGGFQVFSLGEAFGTKVSKIASGEEEVYSERGSQDHEKLVDIDEEGVTFRSYLDGSEHRFTPERSMEIQWNLGADIIFAFDECTSPLAPHEYQRAAMERTHRWAARSLDRHTELDPDQQQALFGVVQGGRHEDLRKESARVLGEMDFDGYGIGGSFNKDDMGTAVRWVNEILPEDKPRHLLGIGEPRDIFEGIENGCDTFDCVAPTRIARTGTLYTHDGQMNMFNTKFQTDFAPVTDECDCYTCAHYTRAYLAHLFRAKEIEAATLASIHNLRFIVRLIDQIRDSITNDTFMKYKKEFLNRYYGKKK